MVLKVYGMVMSPAVLKVIACLKEKELDYEFVVVDFQAGELKKQPFLSLNPFGKMPAFQDGDLTLFESRAITQYIAHTYVDRGSQLVPRDHKEMAIMSVWMEVEAHEFDAAANKLNYEVNVKPMFGMVTDDAAAAKHEEALAKVLDVYEKRLQVSKCLAGDCFTLVDLHHTPLIHYLMASKFKALFEARPHVDAWVRYILTRPAWLKVQELMKQNSIPAS
ncbi:unnamed protein product [Cuscuta epithymum]|uniref:glutathione transferase n=1 Tax=Cuscuta epithymum TaxID=186058 RepID=A0AAV0FY17_9ASTE|nr:unnamed protein product [Cuscuta epithymum]